MTTRISNQELTQLIATFNERIERLPDFSTAIAIGALNELQDYRKCIVDILDSLGPNAVRVREGGGAEDYLMSLSVTVAKLQKHYEILDDFLYPSQPSKIV